MSIFSTILNGLKLLTLAQKKRVWLNVLANTINAVLELFTLGTAVPLIIYQISRSEGEEETLGPFSFLADSFLFQAPFTTTLFVLLGLLLLKNILGSLISAFQFRTCFQIANSLSRSMLHQYFRQPYINFSKGNSGTLAQEISHVPLTFTQKVIISSIQFISELVVILLISIVLIAITPLVFLITASFLLLTTLLALFVKNKITKKVDLGLKEQLTKTSKRLMMALDSFIQVKMLNKQDHFVGRYMEEYERQNQFLSRGLFLQTLGLRVLEFAAFGGILIVLFWFMNGDYSKADMALALGLYTTAAYRLIPSLNKIINANSAIQSSKHTIDVIRERLNVGEINDLAHNEVPGVIDQLQVKGLGILQEGQLLFEPLDFSIRKGEIIGIKAASGSGKTSCLRLLSGLQAPDLGDISLNASTTVLYNNPHWYSRIAYLDQQPLVLDASIRENLCLGNPEKAAQEQSLWEALKKVDLADWAQSRQHGLDSLLGENGLMMSGGEKRRLAFARALLLDPMVYLMDEITNDLDQETTLIILSLVKKLAKQDKLIVWVSHDLHTYEMCEHVIELKPSKS